MEPASVPPSKPNYPAALILGIFGLLLLVGAVLRFVLARDLHLAGSGEAESSLLSSKILTGSGLGLITTGLALGLRRTRRFWLALGGALLWATAWAQGIYAVEEQRREQVLLEREWREIQQATWAADRRALPGGRPGPAQLQGQPLRWGMLGLGTLLLGASVVARSPVPDKPPAEPTA
ncbi:MAG: hypothetical protein JSS02_24495 [Planctomycetes bacterium]|nr:hypothetical protein [Planctomycetota bacterium]